MIAHFLTLINNVKDEPKTSQRRAKDEPIVLVCKTMWETGTAQSNGLSAHISVTITK